MYFKVGDLVLLPDYNFTLNAYFSFSVCVYIFVSLVQHRFSEYSLSVILGMSKHDIFTVLLAAGRPMPIYYTIGLNIL